MVRYRPLWFLQRDPLPAGQPPYRWLAQPQAHHPGIWLRFRFGRQCGRANTTCGATVEACALLAAPPGRTGGAPRAFRP